MIRFDEHIFHMGWFNHQLDNVLFDHFSSTWIWFLHRSPWFNHDLLKLRRWIFRCEAPLRIPLNGSALRPWCHFEVPVSDYRAMRQAADVLDPKYEVVFGMGKNSDVLVLDFLKPESLRTF